METNNQTPTSPPLMPNSWVLNETIEDVNKSTFTYLFKKKQKRTITIILVCVIWILASLWLTNYDFFLELSFWIYVPPLAALVFTYASANNAVEHEFYQQFALANGFSYQKSGWLNDLHGALFNLGHSQSTQDIITGKYDDNSLRIFNYRYIIGSGKNQQTYTDTVFEITYPSALPPILLIVGSQFFGGIVPLFSDWQKVKPEGNFTKNFELYTKKEMEVETLQIFTPDFMEKMLTDWPEFNLEFNGNRLIVFHSKTITSKDELKKIYDLTQFLVTKLDPLISRMRSDISAMQTEAAKYA